MCTPTVRSFFFFFSSRRRHTRFDCVEFRRVLFRSSIPQYKLIHHCAPLSHASLTSQKHAGRLLFHLQNINFRCGGGFLLKYSTPPVQWHQLDRKSVV